MTTHVGQDRVPQLLELRGFHRVALDRLEPRFLRQHGSPAAVRGPAVGFLEHRPNRVDRGVGDLLVRLEDHVGSGRVGPERGRSGVELAGQVDARRVHFGRGVADDAVVRDPPPVEDAVGERLPDSLVVPELVGERVVGGGLLDLHAGRVERDQLRHPAPLARDHAGVAVAVEGGPVGLEGVEVPGRLPDVRPLPQRVGGGDVGLLLPAVRQLLHDLHGADADGLGDPPDHAEDRRDPDGGLGPDGRRQDVAPHAGDGERGPPELDNARGRGGLCRSPAAAAAASSVGRAWILGAGHVRQFPPRSTGRISVR